jgi:excinuclease ABC subunit B
VDQVRFITRVADAREGRDARDSAARVAEKKAIYDAVGDVDAMIAAIESEMKEAAAALDFEAAARLRDQLFELKARAGQAAQKAKRGGLSQIRVQR